MPDTQTPTRHVTTYPSTTAGLTQALADLGGASNRVADVLSRNGHRGVRGSSCGCPVAAYLVAALSDVDWVQVEALTTTVYLADDTELVAATPDPVYRFMDYFDRGTRFQDLDTRRAAR